MAAVGQRVEIASQKGGPRTGLVIGASDTMITVRWDAGGESSLVPGPGVVTVLPGRRGSAAKNAPAAKASAVKPAAKKEAKVAASAKASKSAAKKTPAKKTPAKKTPASKTPAKKAAAKKGR